MGAPLTACAAARPVANEADRTNFARNEVARSWPQPMGNSISPGEAGHFVTAHGCAALAAFPMGPAHRFSLHLLTQRGLNQVKVQI
jgi:hypothetical protein